MMKARKAWLGLLLILVGLLFAALGSSIGQRELQKVKYGDPISFCVRDIGVRLGRTWQISLIRQADTGGALVGGLFPIPATFAEDSSNAQVSLKSSMHAGEVSIHRIEENAVRESRDGILNACKANIYCKQGFSRFNREAEVVEVQAGETIWIKYVDRPIMIGLHGQVMNDLEDIEIRTCPMSPK